MAFHYIKLQFFFFISFLFFFGKFKYWYMENTSTFSFSGTVSGPLRGIFVHIYATVTVS